MAENQTREVFLNKNLEQDASSEESATRKGKQKTKGKKGSNSTAIRKNTNAQGYGSSQRAEDTNIGPLDADLNELPSKRRRSENNETGPGLG